MGGLVAAMSLGGMLGAAIATPVARRFGTDRGMLLSELLAAPFGLLIPLTGPGPRLALVAASGVIIGLKSPSATCSRAVSGRRTRTTCAAVSRRACS